MDADLLARLALRHLRDGEVKLVLVGGAPGTGKTTLATALADHFGLVLLASDVVRDQVHPAAARLDRYRPEAKATVYRELIARARHALVHGESVVIDATWGDPAWRSAALALGVDTCSTVVQLECRAPVEVAASRADRRRQSGHDASEADGAVSLTLAQARSPWPEAVPVNTTLPIGAAFDVAANAVRPPD